MDYTAVPLIVGSAVSLESRSYPTFPLFTQFCSFMSLPVEVTNLEMIKELWFLNPLHCLCILSAAKYVQMLLIFSPRLFHSSTCLHKPQISCGPSSIEEFLQTSSVRLKGQQNCLFFSFKLLHSNYTHPSSFTLHGYKVAVCFLTSGVNLTFWLHWLLLPLAFAFPAITRNYFFSKRTPL